MKKYIVLNNNGDLIYSSNREEDATNYAYRSSRQTARQTYVYKMVKGVDIKVEVQSKDV